MADWFNECFVYYSFNREIEFEQFSETTFYGLNYKFCTHNDNNTRHRDRHVLTIILTADETLKRIFPLKTKHGIGLRSQYFLYTVIVKVRI